MNGSALFACCSPAIRCSPHASGLPLPSGLIVRAGAAWDRLPFQRRFTPFLLRRGAHRAGW